MIHHHFIGAGRISARLRESARHPEALLDEVSAIVSGVDFRVVARQAVEFDNGGLTLVWVLAESHLVLHHWEIEGFATLDLHLCNYRGSNIERARRLVEALSDLCFIRGSDRWDETHLADPVAGPVPVPELDVI